MSGRARLKAVKASTELEDLVADSNGGRNAVLPKCKVAGDTCVKDIVVALTRDITVFGRINCETVV